MAKDNTGYDDALNTFVRENHSHLSLLYGTTPDQVSQTDLKVMLGYTADHVLQSIFEFKGKLGPETLFELRRIPASDRTLEGAAKAIAHHEVGLILNKPLNKARDVLPTYGKALSSFVTEWRTRKMRATFRKLITAADDVDRKTVALLAAVKQYRSLPTMSNKVAVQVAIKGVNKSLLVAHFHAKAGAAWSLRAGFSGIQVARAVNTVYIRKISKLSANFTKLDGWLNGQGISSKIGEGISRRKKILNRELMMANADPQYHREILDKVDKRQIKSFEHGVPNYA
jgi:hypothetical protein